MFLNTFAYWEAAWPSSNLLHDLQISRLHDLMERFNVMWQHVSLTLRISSSYRHQYLCKQQLMYGLKFSEFY